MVSLDVNGWCPLVYNSFIREVGTARRIVYVPESGRCRNPELPNPHSDDGIDIELAWLASSRTLTGPSGEIELATRGVLKLLASDPSNFY